jgi:hypothetical protein
MSIVSGQRRTFILRRRGCCEPCQCVAKVPRHPLLRVRGKFRAMPLQFREVVEGIGSVQLTGVNQTHEQITDMCSVQRLVEKCVPAIEDRLLQCALD